jgi:AraC family transcriptional regulator, transcriptional activator of pobA
MRVLILGTAMMKKYQPLVLQKLNLRVPGIHVRHLALNRHLEETTAVRPHAHKFAQCLLYLSGQGKQRVRDHFYPVQAGTAAFFPAHVEHAFQRAGSRRPICLAIDFDWRGSRSRPAVVELLPLSVVHELRQHISAIAHWQRHAGTQPPLEVSALVLKLLALILNGLALTPQPPAGLRSPVLRQVEQMLVAPDAQELSAGELARRTGYQHDYLNRLLKGQTGLTLGQFRARKRVVQAQQLLPQMKNVAEVAAALGFHDPNYFSRWFRKQTGQSPTGWSQHRSVLSRF